MMRLYKFINLMLWAGLFSGALFAHGTQKEIHVAVKMVGIERQKTAEKEADELFFNITQYSNLKGTRENRIPEYPTHWASTQLHSLKNLVLWEGKMAEGETLKLVLSLIEQDSPPWNPDDAIGAAEVNLLNQKGRLKIQWAVSPFKKNNPEVEMLKRAVPQRYIFKGSGSRYDIAFSVEQK